MQVDSPATTPPHMPGPMGCTGLDWGTSGSLPPNTGSGLRNTPPTEDPGLRGEYWGGHGCGPRTLLR